jgi:hypothetical protein
MLKQAAADCSLFFFTEVFNRKIGAKIIIKAD